MNAQLPICAPTPQKCFVSENTIPLVLCARLSFILEILLLWSLCLRCLVSQGCLIIEASGMKICRTFNWNKTLTSVYYVEIGLVYRHDSSFETRRFCVQSQDSAVVKVTISACNILACHAFIYHVKHLWTCCKHFIFSLTHKLFLIDFTAWNHNKYHVADPST